MIARIWRGATREADKDTYFEYLRKTGLKEYAYPRNQGVWVLRRVYDGKAEFTLISLWDVSSQCFDTIATPTMRVGDARNMSGAKNIPRTLGRTSVDAQIISANDGAVSSNAVERRMLRV